MFGHSSIQQFLFLKIKKDELSVKSENNKTNNY